MAKIHCKIAYRTSGDARSDAGVPEDRNANEDRQFPTEGDPPSGLDSPVAYGGKAVIRAGSPIPYSPLPIGSGVIPNQKAPCRFLDGYSC